MVKGACKDQLRHLFVGCIEREHQLSIVVGYIFIASMNMDRLGNMIVKKDSDKVTSKLMMLAAEPLDDFVATGPGHMMSISSDKKYWLDIDISSDLDEGLIESMSGRD